MLNSPAFPITRAVFYKNKVALYERETVVEAREATVLVSVPKTSIAAVLKSLQLSCENGAVSSITVSSVSPANASRCSPFDKLPPTASYSAIFQVLQGAEISVHTSDGEAITGLIASTSSQRAEEGHPDIELLQLLTHEGGECPGSYTPL
jgi:hypothetical protein